MESCEYLNQAVGLIQSDHNKSIDDSLKNLLSTIRKHLSMDVAFISEFSDTERIFRHVDLAPGNSTISVGMSDPLDESYCKRVVDGRLPRLIQNAKAHPESSMLDVTHKMPVGAHISVPIMMDNGKVYGTFCSFSHSGDNSLNQRDLSMMEAFASIAAKQIEQDVLNKRKGEEIHKRVKNAINNEELSIVYQPIYNLHTMKLAGFEALSRFSGLPYRTPDIWFQEAFEVGLGIDLESKAVRKSLEMLDLFPADIYISVNLSPEVIVSGHIENIFQQFAVDRVILEVTEHAIVKHYGDVNHALKDLRKNGIWIAVDDAGAGYASFKHILNLIPEVIKIDISITRDIHLDRARQALTSAFQWFSSEIECRIVAEGIENELELEELKKIGIKYGQGYFLGKPMPIDDALVLCRRT